MTAESWVKFKLGFDVAKDIQLMRENGFVYWQNSREVDRSTRFLQGLVKYKTF